MKIRALYIIEIDVFLMNTFLICNP